VVASRCANLAGQRSSQAAKDIKDLITKQRQSRCRTGSSWSTRRVAALAEIVESIKDVANIVVDISTASSEQASGIEQVNKALTQMDEVTQQNSALVEEAHRDAQDAFDQQAQAMSERVALFRVEEDEAAQSVSFCQGDAGSRRDADAAAQASARPPAGPAPKHSRRAAARRLQSRARPCGIACCRRHADWKEF